MRRPPIEIVLTTLLLSTSAGAAEVDRDEPPNLLAFCVSDIGDGSGLENIYISDLNQRGQVLGLGYLGEGTEVFQWDRRRGYRFIEELAYEQFIPASPAAALNDRGQVVGTQNVDPEGSILRAVVWTRGRELRVLEPAPGDDHSTGLAINNRGDVTGTTGPYPSESDDGVRSVVWDRRSRVHVIPNFPDATSSRPYDINQAGQVVGGSDTPSGVRGYIWDRKSGIRPIPGLLEGDLSSVPRAINDHGEVAASGSFPGGYYGQHAIVWSEESGVVDLGDLPGGPELSHASDINNHRQVVGYATSSRGVQAVVWDSEGRIRNLNQLLVRDNPADQSLHLQQAGSINDAGWITAVGVDTDDDRSRYVLLTPARVSSSGGYDCSCGR